MKHKWEYKVFNEAISALTPKSKIGKSDYLEQGAYPIISQEEEFISGYWNNQEDVTPISGEAVVFGDHSRVLKYVDFDFVVGADGVKILLPRNGLQAKFLFYFLKWKDVPSLGYSRHFKLLKEFDYPVPPSLEQERIVAELDKINEVIADCRELLRNLDTLAQSLFYDTFGDPVTNPKGWELKRLEDVCILKSGDSSANHLPDGNIPYVKVGDMNLDANKYSIVSSSRFVDVGNKSKMIFPIGTTIFPKRGGAILTNKKRITGTQICCDLNIMGAIPTNIHPIYLYYFFLLLDFSELVDGSTVPQINNSDIYPILIPLPSLALQNQFAAQVERIEAQKKAVEATMTELQTLLDSRMDYWFN